MLIAVHLIICISLICIVLLQQGKGADIGASFGGGGNTLFGAAGADTLLTKITTGTAALFMLTSILLATLGTQTDNDAGDLFTEMPASSNGALPAGTASTTDKPSQAVPLDGNGDVEAPAAPPQAASSGTPPEESKAIPSEAAAPAASQ